MEHHSAVLLRRLNPYCARALEGAASLCQTRAHAEITPEHWLLKLLEQGEGDLTVLARRYEWDMDAVWQSLLSWLDAQPRSVRTRPELSASLQTLLKQAWLAATLVGDEQIRSIHLLTAMIETSGLTRCDGLWPLMTLTTSQLERLRPLLEAQSDERHDVALSEQAGNASIIGRAPPLQHEAQKHAEGGIAQPAVSQVESILNRFTVDVTARAREGKIDPVFGRDNEIRQVVDILSRRRKNNPILVGEPGVGKTALVEGLALRIAEGNVPESLKPVIVRTLDLGLLQAGAGVKGEFEQRLKNIIDAVQQSPVPVLLFIDEAHTIIGAGNQAGGADAANLLKPALARGELRTIAATTWSEYKQYFERDAALERRFQMVKVDEPDDDTACLMLRGLKSRYAEHHGVHITGEAVRAAVTLWGLPYTERYCFRPAEMPRPEIHGTLPARIESREKNDTYAHLDEQGRYRVKLDFDREGTEPGYGYLWLRMAKPYAGETLGWHTPLTDGTEVAIAYSNGDIDLPYIACALHDSEHPDLVNRDNHTRNILRTPANNKLRMEDRRGEEHIKLATEYGKTQLKTGHLVDSQGQRRGTGTELRTDEWGTLRAGKGLFVAADAQAKAQGDALNMDTALREIDRLNQQLQQLEMAAEQAQALKADVDSQIQMFEQRLKPLNEAVLFSAPEGMALTSGEDMQLAASRNLAVNAGEDFSVGVMGNATLLTGEKLGLFARTGQLSLKSGEGPIDVQAQNASMRLFAEKKLTLSSASDISFAGKKRITLIGGGSYLRLEAGKVEYGTTATYMRKVKRTMFAGANSTPTSSISMPLVEDLIKDGFFDEQFRILNDSGKPMTNVPYFISSESGETFKGVTDNHGLCKRVFSKESSKLTIWLGVQALEKW